MISKTLNTQEVCALLNIKPQTLYAYVSRGLLRSAASNTNKRNYRYLRSDVEQLQQRKTLHHHPKKVLQEALHWGAPLLNTQLSHFADGMLYYRDLPITSLVQQPFEHTITLLWPFGENKIHKPLLNLVNFKQHYQQLSFLSQTQLALVLLMNQEAHANMLTPQRIMNSAFQILATFVYLSCGYWPQNSISECLQVGWQVSAKTRACLNTALVVCTEHELNTSTFTARCIASTGANLYEVIVGALAAFSGNKHGGILELITAEYRAIINHKSPKKYLLQRLQQGTLPGFNHPFYLQGDPRAQLLLAALAKAQPARQPYLRLKKVLGILQHEGLHPSIDFILVAMEDCLKLPPNAALQLFAIGRVVGWVAHALEQYQSGTQIRPRSGIS